MLSEKKPFIEGHPACDLQEVSRVGRSIETEQMSSCRVGRRRDREAIAQDFFSECENALE